MSGESSTFANDQEHLRLQMALRESEILRELAELLASSLDLNHILCVLVRRTTEACGVERCAVWLLENAHNVLRPAAYYLASQHSSSQNVQAAEQIWYHTPLSLVDPVMRRLLESKGMLTLEDLGTEPGMRSFAEMFFVRSLLLVALVREDRVVGMMSLDDPDKIRTFSLEQQQLVRAIGLQASIAIDNARLYQEAQMERRRAEQLIERASTLDAVFHTMTEGISVLNVDGQVVLRNQAASYFLSEDQYTKEGLAEILKRHPAYTLHGQLVTVEDFPVTRALRGERIRGERLVVRRADGAERVIETNIAPMHDATGKQIGVVSAFRDITEQRRVEQRIRHALETMLHVAVAVSGVTDIKDILRSVLEMTLTTLNCDRGSMHVYDEEQHLFVPLLSFGFPAEIEKQWLTEQSYWLPPAAFHSHRQEKVDRFETQLMDGHATIIHTEQYPQFVSPFNSTTLLAAPITNANRLLGLMMLDCAPAFKDGAHIQQQVPREFSIWDMAVIEGIAQLAGLAIEQARWQQEAAHARTSEAAMREANALKDEFLAITAHEFRTPLTIILAHSQFALRVLRRKTNKLTEQAPEVSEALSHIVENLSTIAEQTHQLTNIVNNFLEVTQINRGQLVLKVEELDLAEIAKQVVANYSKTSTEHQITCIIDLHERPYRVMGDSARLLQVITNLVQNAIKYSPHGGPVTVHLRQDVHANGKATIEVCVQDKGIGIPKDAQTRLFERFYRAPNTEGSKARGIGLGLYLVAELVRMHNGTIRVESSGIPGEGSRFIFTLPGVERETIASVGTT